MIKESKTTIFVHDDKFYVNFTIYSNFFFFLNNIF